MSPAKIQPGGGFLRPARRCWSSTTTAPSASSFGQLGERAGFDVTACADGSEALTELRLRHHDLAAIDLCMPGTGGLDVLRAMRIRRTSTARSS